MYGVCVGVQLCKCVCVVHALTGGGNILGGFYGLDLWKLIIRDNQRVDDKGSKGTQTTEGEDLGDSVLGHDDGAAARGSL